MPEMKRREDDVDESTVALGCSACHDPGSRRLWERLDPESGCHDRTRHGGGDPGTSDGGFGIRGSIIAGGWRKQRGLMCSRRGRSGTDG